MMLCRIVPQVLGGRSPTYIDFLCAVAHPIEPHSYYFTTLCAVVVSLHGSGRLWLTNLSQDVPNVDSFLRI
jgi:hypothetical protein